MTNWDLQSLHRVRERWVMRRTAVINQIRGLLLERGITLRQGRCHVNAQTHNCQVNSYRRIHLEAHVLQYLFRLLRDDRLYDKVRERDNFCLLDQMKADNARIRLQLEGLPKRRNLLFDLYETSQITKSEFLERRVGHARKKEELAAVLMENEAKLKKLEAAVINPEKFRAALKDLEATFERSDIAVKKGKLQALIDTIVIKNQSFKINFHLSPTAD
jgi:hypothetical protein